MKDESEKVKKKQAKLQEGGRKRKRMTERGKKMRKIRRGYVVRMRRRKSEGAKGDGKNRK